MKRTPRSLGHRLPGARKLRRVLDRLRRALDLRAFTALPKTRSSSRGAGHDRVRQNR